MPRVTVIIPTHNRAHLLGRAIRSVLSQTFVDFELLVVDDASADATHEVVEGFHDSRIRYIRHETNGGESESRNTGVRNAQSEYIAYLDDDDEWLPEKLEKQVAVLDRCPSATGLVFTAMNYVELGTGRKLYRPTPFHRGFVLEHLLEANFLAGPTALVRMECFRAVGMYDPRIRFAPDWEMWIRMARRFEFEVIPEPLYNYSIHPNQLTANYKVQIEGFQKIIELHEDLFLQYPKAYANQLTKLGILYYLCGNPKLARAFFQKALRHYPLHFRAYKLWLLSFLSEDYFRRLLAFREARVSALCMEK
jgi:glycosyltransferase involved in cell wall biosynthesis